MPRTNITGGGVVIVSAHPNRRSAKIFPPGLRTLGPSGSQRRPRRPRIARASPTILILIASGLSLLAARNTAYADCASGDGNITSPGTCTTPQNLTGQTGTVVGGATLATGASQTAYTISSNNSMVTNSGTVSSQGAPAFQASGRGGTLTNSGTITATGDTPTIVSAVLNIVNTGDIIGSSFKSTFNPGTGVTFTGGAIVYTTSATTGIPHSTVTQAGGTIKGDIFFNELQQGTLNVTGGAINGLILGSTGGGGTGSSGQFGGTVNFNLGSGTFTTGGGISVGALNVNSGTLVLGNDLGINVFTNNAILQVNGTRTLTGTARFLQNSTGTLAMQVSPAGSSQLVMKGGLTTFF